MRIRTLAICLILTALVAHAAVAQDVHEPKTPWGLGAQGGYMWIPGFLLDGYYDKHESISAAFYGVYGTYSFKWFDLQFGVNHSQINFEDGEYLVAGKDDDEIDYVEADLAMVDVMVGVQWRWELHEYVEWDAGVGLGFGFLYGKYESTDVVDGVRGDKVDKPRKPPVVPVVNVQTGVTIFAVPKVFAFNLDFGLRDGLFAGGGVQGFFY